MCDRLLFKKLIPRNSLLSLAAALSFIPPSSLWAASKAPDFSVRSERQSSAKAEGWVVTASAPEHFHFNTTAPMSLLSGTVSIRPELAKPDEVRFKIPSDSGTVPPEPLHISLYLCDDAKTFCEKHTLNYSLAGSTHGASAPSVGQSITPAFPPAASESAMTSSHFAALAKTHGFLLNEPAEALARAKKENKPLMIDFFGIWCPPCNELDEKVFSSPRFAKSSSRFIRLKLDADSKVAWALKSRYQISGYPTIIFASPEGDEISRIAGFRPLDEFLSELDRAWVNRDRSLEKLEKQAKTGDRAAADLAGVIRLNRGEGAEAAKLLAGTKDKRESWHLAELKSLEDSNAPADQRIRRLDQAIAEFPKTPNTIYWLETLSQLYQEQKQNTLAHDSLRKAIALGLELSQHPERLRGYDATPADLLEYAANDREELEGKKAARADWLAAAKAYAKRGVGKKERANNLEMAYCLGKAGEYRQAKAIYDRLEKIYPKEYTFFHAHALLELEAQHLDAALGLAKQSLQYSYGDNRLRAILLLAQITKAKGDQKATREILDQALQELQLPSDSRIRTNRYARALKKLRETLN
jgi:thiol-disulfide isomerase/thioredoxin